ncbi:MAG: hypothetical protein K2M76_02745 [Muribaculaceae bacterium]|nr:hypothetical protein [Muribaculaceae bacterium]
MKNLKGFFLIAICSLLSVSCKEEEIGCEFIKFDCAQFDIGADGGVAIASAENVFEYWSICEVIVCEKLDDGRIQLVDRYSRGDGTYGENNNGSHFCNNEIDATKDKNKLIITIGQNHTENERVIVFGLAPGLIDNIIVTQATHGR